MRRAPLLLAFLVLAGCGGRSGPVLVVLPALSLEDGTLGALYDGSGFTVNTSNPGPGTAGDGSGGVVYRGLFSFDLSALPAGATIETAILPAHQSRVRGTPYADLSAAHVVTYVP